MYQSPSHHFSTYIYFRKYCKENPWTINVHNPSTKSAPFAGCGWHSIYWSAVNYSTSYCWDKATVMLLYKQSEHRWEKKITIVQFLSFDSCGLLFQWSCMKWQHERVNKWTWRWLSHLVLQLYVWAAEERFIRRVMQVSRQMILLT